METFHSLMGGHLPPVGQRLVFKRSQGLPALPGLTATWVNSGTAALALALLDAKHRAPNCSHPEVILPAYGCPDLVSAAEWAGVTPVLVDTQADDICSPLSTLKAAINPSTLAVLAVTFLGVRALWLDELAALKVQHPNLVIIEDNAQWFFEAPAISDFSADYMITSFGRGKPVSLLGGGAIFSKHPLMPQTLQTLQHSQPSALFPLKGRTYNFLLNPYAYWLLNTLPFIKLGTTEYKPLTQVAHLDTQRLALIPANWQAYCNRSRLLEHQYLQLLARTHNYSVCAGMGSPRQQRLLRFPVLCRNLAQRDGLLKALQQQGLGATALYQQPLIKIAGVAPRVKSFNPPLMAQSLANRLITLPLHEGVKLQHLRKIEALLVAWDTGD